MPGNLTRLIATVNSYLQRLAIETSNRRVGSAGNRSATDLVATTLSQFGFAVEMPEFDCFDWTQDGVNLETSNQRFDACASPYSLGCSVVAPLVATATVAELERIDATGKILLLYGQIASGQLMPRNFPFYNPEEHQRILQLLDQKNPQAIIAATTQDPGMAGSIYPFPLIEDGDVDTPSVYMTAEEGARLIQFVGHETTLISRAQRIPARACNVIGRKGMPDPRVVLFAHIDAKMDTPGAIDNAAGVAAILLLAEALAGYDGALGIEIVALNGEDYYAAPGQMLYLADNADRFGEILLGVNIDGAGYHKGKIAYSTYQASNDLDHLIEATMNPYESLAPGDPWYQGDHSLFLMKGRPALAFTSERLTEIMSEIIHTPRDTPDIVDPAKIVALASALRDLLLKLNQRIT